jgi:CTP:molybdopterin cytidylyltransferase MocA
MNKKIIATITAGVSIRMGKIKQNLIWDERNILSVSVGSPLLR